MTRQVGNDFRQRENGDVSGTTALEMSSKSGNREEGHPSSVPLEDQKSPSSLIITDYGELKLSHPSFSVPVFPPLILTFQNIRSLTHLPQVANLTSFHSASPPSWPVWWQRGLTVHAIYSEKAYDPCARRRISPLWDFVPFFARCWMHLASREASTPPQNLPPSCWIHFYQGVSHFFNLWASTRFRVKGKANPHRAFRLPGNSDEGFITRQRWLPFSFQLWLVAQKPQPSYREALLNHHYFSY